MFDHIFQVAHRYPPTQNQLNDEPTFTSKTLLFLSCAAGLTSLVIASLAASQYLSLATSGKIISGLAAYQLFYTGYIAVKYWRCSDFVVNNSAAFGLPGPPDPETPKRTARTIAKFVFYFILLNAPLLIGGSLATKGLISAPLLATLVIVPLSLHFLLQACWKNFSNSCRGRWGSYLYR